MELLTHIYVPLVAKGLSNAQIHYVVMSNLVEWNSRLLKIKFTVARIASHPS